MTFTCVIVTMKKNCASLFCICILYLVCVATIVKENKFLLSLSTKLKEREKVKKKEKVGFCFFKVLFNKRDISFKRKLLNLKLQFIIGVKRV